jgi:hypothetical protein
MRTVAVKVRLIPAGWRYALFSGGNIFAGGNSSVHGSMRANGANGITIDTGGSFNFYALNDLDAAETPGFIRDNANGIPPQYEYQRGPAIPDLPQIKYTDFQQTSLFPRARIYNVLPVDPTPGNDPFTDDDVATDPSGGILPKVQADGSINWYYSYNVTKNGGQVNDQWTVDQFNAAFSANPSYLPGLPPKDYAMINWRTGVDQNGDGVIDNYRLHLSGNGTITSTIVVYGDSGDPLNPNDNGSVQIDGGATFEPVTGVALVANGVDFSKLNGNTQIGTQANPALIYASGYANWGSNGTLTTVGCVAVGGSQLATVTIGGNSSHWFNPSFIDKMPENMQLVFTRPTYYSEWLSWQVL